MAHRTKIYVNGRRPPLDEDLILSWADEHFQRTGAWPVVVSGQVDGHEDENWNSVDMALRKGFRGLLLGSSLAILLQERRGAVYKNNKPEFTVEQVLAWADLHYERHGRYPYDTDGPIEGAVGETWGAVENALRQGLRGLPGKSSLFKLLNENRRMGRLQRTRPPLTEDFVLYWADAHFATHGSWPKGESGPVDGQPGESWGGIQAALIVGHRGLGPGSSVLKLLVKHGRVSPKPDLLDLTVEQILEWADRYHETHGSYPQRNIEVIEGTGGETWEGVNRALVHGRRGLPGNSSLAKLFEAHRGVHNQRSYPKLSIEQILEWMDDHHARTGEWPNKKSGTVQACPPRKWKSIDNALSSGLQGDCPPTTLVQLAVTRRGKKDVRAVPPFSIDQITGWMTAYAGRHGKYPSAQAGSIEEAPGELWHRVESALILGQRGLPGGQTLATLRKQLIDEGTIPNLKGT